MQLRMPHVLVNLAQETSLLFRRKLVDYKSLLLLAVVLCAPVVLSFFFVSTGGFLCCSDFHPGTVSSSTSAP